MKSAAFRHLLRYFRASKRELVQQVLTPYQNDISIAAALGGLECLYWQALGNGELTLAKGIVRLISKSNAHHQVRVLTVTTELGADNG